MKKPMKTMLAGAVDSPVPVKKKRERVPPSAAMVIKRGVTGDGIVRRKKSNHTSK